MQPESFLRTLTVIHTVLLVGLVAFALFCYYRIGSFTAPMYEGDIFIYVVPVVAAAGYFLSQYVFRKQLQSIPEKETLTAKLEKYKAVILIKFALLVGLGFLALIAYYLSGNALHLVIAITLIAYLFVQRPTAGKITKDLPLTLEEQKQFDTLGG
jgi:hypothetical protein